MVNKDGKFCIAMSNQGFSALTQSQRDILNAHYIMVITEVSTIEIVGGGSCRCMLAEDWSTVLPHHLYSPSTEVQNSLTQEVYEKPRLALSVLQGDITT